MKICVCFLTLVLSSAPVFAQQDGDESALRELGMFGVYSLGDLALQEYQRGNDPVQQLKRFFAAAKQPLSSVQEKQLNSIVEAEVKAVQASTQAEDAVRRLNLEYTRKVSAALTPEQRATLRQYRTEQIMMRGGFPALKLILENAQVPFTADQETKAQALYLDFNRQVGELARGSKGVPERTQLDKLEGESLGQVVRLLTPEQRRALAASRQGTLAAKVRP
jgi:Spy/CpxP family protein refolding chaperone